jgi:hypothetical protein
VIAVLDCYRDLVPNMCIYAKCAYLIGKYSYASEYIYICFFVGKIYPLFLYLLHWLRQSVYSLQVFDQILNITITYMFAAATW